MRRWWAGSGVMLTVGLLVLSLSYLPKGIATHAQPEGWQHGCDSAALPVIAATTSQVNYPAICETYLVCTATGKDSTTCQFKALLMAEEGCEDDLCLLRSRLYANAILIPDVAFTNLFSPENAALLPPILGCVDISA